MLISDRRECMYGKSNRIYKLHLQFVAFVIFILYTHIMFCFFLYYVSCFGNVPLSFRFFANQQVKYILAQCSMYDAIHTQWLCDMTSRQMIEVNDDNNNRTLWEQLNWNYRIFIFRYPVYYILQHKIEYNNFRMIVYSVFEIRLFLVSLFLKRDQYGENSILSVFNFDKSVVFNWNLEYFQCLFTLELNFKFIPSLSSLNHWLVLIPYD